MATLVLSAVGATVGAGFGGTVLGLSGAVIGRAVGATLGRVIDQRLIGKGSATVETGRIDRFRVTGASEGAAVGRVWGRMRVSGQVIWASRFREHVRRSGGGGKGAPRPVVAEYGYTVSLAVALCEGEITRLGRIWADGVEVARADLELRVYPGDEEQLPDPKIEAVEGAGRAPAYRGVAYVVIEDLDLAAYGNRVPQFSFEVVRPAQGPENGPAPAARVPGVALIPGTGEYALATRRVSYRKGPGEAEPANVSSPSGRSDFLTAVADLREELPNCRSVSLVVSWFGDDLRCGACRLRPKVENAGPDGQEMPWRAGGLGRAQAELVARREGAPVYGGTPADGAVIEAIAELRAGGQEVMFYPFILMEQLPGNGRPDPWSGAADQPVLPWRGRITLSAAPGRPGSPDRSALAAAEVAAFFGQAQRTDFAAGDGTVSYHGPPEWSYRRFILHYAHLAAMAGGVDAFCIGSEMRGLTQIRGAGDAFPAVAALRALAADVRAILGPGCRIGYAADWTEYGGYQDGAGNLYFPLDPLWADAEVDFVGIDNYVPLSDWREGEGHLDAGWGSIHDTGYLKANILGGEGYDWFYAAPEHREAQIRTPIADGAHAEPWVYRAKDIPGWWSNPHHERIGGVRQAAPTPWVPLSKPIWFTEIGCAAVDKGTNQPNRFLDPKSSESGLPHHSDGRRDDLIQLQYLTAMLEFWEERANNPVSDLYGGRMVDTGRTHVWAWDTRPFPRFPLAVERWSDGENWARGHWISGRIGAQTLAAVVREICAQSGVAEVDTTQLHGLVRGYALGEVDSARGALQPLMLAYGFDAVEREGRLVFRSRGGRARGRIGPDDLAEHGGFAGPAETARAPEAELAGRVRLTYVEAEGDYAPHAAEAILPDEAAAGVAQSEMPLALTRAEGQRIVERWLAEARVARDAVRLALPPSRGRLGAGDVVELDAAGARGLFRIDRAERAGAIEIEAVRIEAGIYAASGEVEERAETAGFAIAAPVFPLFLDLPLMRGDEAPHAPHLAVTATPWPGAVALHSSGTGDGYELDRVIGAGAVVGLTETALAAAPPGILDRGPALRVRLWGGGVAPVTPAALLDGANLMAIGSGSGADWELFQFAGAELVGPDTYELTLRLRGQAGTDGVMPEVWPTGSYVVLIDGVPEQIGLAPAERGLVRHYRIGPAQRPPDDASYVHAALAFEGAGLRPYAPCHLVHAVTAAGDVMLRWIRRSRIDGDSWASFEVPLGEAAELYLVRVVAGGATLREEVVTVPEWTYPAASRAADGAAGAFSVLVAQVSQSYGPGPFRRIEING